MRNPPGGSLTVRSFDVEVLSRKVECDVWVCTAWVREQPVCAELGAWDGSVDGLGISLRRDDDGCTSVDGRELRGTRRMRMMSQCQS